MLIQLFLPVEPSVAKIFALQVCCSMLPNSPSALEKRSLAIPGMTILHLALNKPATAHFMPDTIFLVKFILTGIPVMI